MPELRGLWCGVAALLACPLSASLEAATTFSISADLRHFSSVVSIEVVELDTGRTLAKLQQAASAAPWTSDGYPCAEDIRISFQGDAGDAHFHAKARLAESCEAISLGKIVPRTYESFRGRFRNNFRQPISNGVLRVAETRADSRHSAAWKEIFPHLRSQVVYGDADGLFSIDLVDAALPVTVVALAPDHEQAEIEVETKGDLDLVGLDSIREVSVVVEKNSESGDDALVVHCEFRPRSSGSSALYSSCGRQESDVSNDFRFESVPIGTIRLTAGTIYSPAQATAVVDGSDQFVRLELPVGREFSGRVVDSETGSMLAGASVTASALSSPVPIGFAESDASGEFSLFGLPVAEVRLRVTLDGYRDFSGGFAVEAGAASARIPLEKLHFGSLSVTVVSDIDGGTMAGVEVSIHDQKSGSFEIKNTDEAGMIRLEVPASDYRISLRGVPGSAAAVDVRVAPGSVEHVSLLAQPGGTVTGSYAQASCDGTLVIRSQSESGAAAGQAFAASGRFLVGNVPAGSIALKFFCGGKLLLTMPVSLAPGEHKELGLISLL